MLEEEGGERDYRYHFRYRGGQVTGIASTQKVCVSRVFGCALKGFSSSFPFSSPFSFPVKNSTKSRLSTKVLELGGCPRFNVPGPKSSVEHQFWFADSDPAPSLGSRRMMVCALWFLLCTWLMRGAATESVFSRAMEASRSALSILIKAIHKRIRYDPCNRRVISDPAPTLHPALVSVKVTSSQDQTFLQQARSIDNSIATLLTSRWSSPVAAANWVVCEVQGGFFPRTLVETFLPTMLSKVPSHHIHCWLA